MINVDIGNGAKQNIQGENILELDFLYATKRQFFYKIKQKF